VSGAWWLSYGRHHNVCGECNGDKELEHVNGDIMLCPVCNGTGKVFSELPLKAKLTDEQIEEHDMIEYARIEIRRRMYETITSSDNKDLLVGGE
jgi:hypothetical protein